MDLMFDISGFTSQEEEFTTSKRDVLKFLKIIGVDSRFTSYTPEKIYINNLRFSKFSRKREATFNKQYPEIEVVRNKLFLADGETSCFKRYAQGHQGIWHWKSSQTPKY